ncbi:hypothetical protein D1AOALGA4SA_8079 [Olavius algarvensis Delta 1 endosymbiont]|nr:hypothetical protein D1AOALGA4SA_8079 [Olavius algarvensis Delta 1 endosymbiont]
MKRFDGVGRNNYIKFFKSINRLSLSTTISFYLVAENLVLWARSEPIGYAVNLLQSGAE